MSQPPLLQPKPVPSAVRVAESTRDKHIPVLVTRSWKNNSTFIMMTHGTSHLFVVYMRDAS